MARFRQLLHNVEVRGQLKHACFMHSYLAQLQPCSCASCATCSCLRLLAARPGPGPGLTQVACLHQSAELPFQTAWLCPATGAVDGRLVKPHRHPRSQPPQRLQTNGRGQTKDKLPWKGRALLTNGEPIGPSSLLRKVPLAAATDRPEGAEPPRPRPRPWAWPSWSWSCWVGAPCPRPRPRPRPRVATVSWVSADDWVAACPRPRPRPRVGAITAGSSSSRRLPRPRPCTCA